MLAARLPVEYFFCAVEEERPLLRGNHLDLHAVLGGNLRESFVGAESLTIDDGVGHDDHGASIAGEQAAHFTQRGAHLFCPEVARFVEAKATVTTT